VEPILRLINRKLRSTTPDADDRLSCRKHRAITTIFLFAASLEGDELQSISGATLRAIGIIWNRYRDTWVPAMQYITALLKEPSPPSLNLVIILAAPDVAWRNLLDGRTAVDRWATAVLAVPYTEEVGQSVVDATFQIASEDSLRPHIPIGIWALFKERPSLPPECLRRERGAHPNVIRHIRGLGDLEILTSYFLLVWSTRCFPPSEAFDVMEISIREDFCGTWMGQHRQDLVERLKHVLREFSRGNDHISGRFPWYVDKDDIRKATQRYGKLKDVLAEVERKAAMNLTRTFPDSHISVDKLILMAIAQGTTRRVLFPYCVHDAALGEVDVPSQCLCAGHNSTSTFRRIRRRSPSLPIRSRGRSDGTHPDIVRHTRALEDIRFLQL
jgi:hypothetical protein